MFKHKYNDLLTDYEIREYEKQHHIHGPMSLLYEAIKDNRKILINLRSNKKLIANIINYDKHFNMVLENVLEIYKRPGKIKELQERVFNKLFLRGDSVIAVVILED